GYQFLRHVERTRLLVHVIDMAGFEGRDPYEDYQKINAELKAYDENLLDRPQIVVANKMDMPNAADNLKRFKERLEDQTPVYEISALTKDGLKNLLFAIAEKLEDLPKQTAVPENIEEKVVYRYQKQELPFEVTRDPDGAFVLYGTQIEKLFKMTDFTRDEAVQRFSRQLRGMGVDDALRERGAKDGDIVRLLDFEFEFIE